MNALRQAHGVGASRLTSQLKARQSTRKRSRYVDAAAAAMLKRAMRRDGFLEGGGGEVGIGVQRAEQRAGERGAGTQRQLGVCVRLGAIRRIAVDVHSV